ncbi:MAG: nicotinate-nucleotide adenylyltransferase [Betaproteobacteria bacterium]
MQAIGILGGSFDPIHVGHLALARAALDSLPLAQVRLLPAGQPWQKGALTAPAADRQRMVELAIASDARLVCDARELNRPGPTYTVDTLRELRAVLGADLPLVLILGADQLERLDTWRDWQALSDFAHIAVAGRPQAEADVPDAVRASIAPRRAAPTAVAAAAHGCVVPIAMAPVDASATEVRALLAQPPSPAAGARLAQLLPPAVLDYIRAHRLYR